MTASYGTLPQVGDRLTVRGVACVVVKVRDFGTMDVEAIDPAIDKAWRITGLGWGRLSRPKN